MINAKEASQMAVLGLEKRCAEFFSRAEKRNYKRDKGGEWPRLSFSYK